MASLWKYATHVAILTLGWTTSSLADKPPYHDISAYTKLVNNSGGFPRQEFRSSPIVAPIFQVNRFVEEAVDDASHIFLGAVYGNVAGPMIFDSRDLSLVYADQTYFNAYASSVQVVNGTKYLVFWEGERSRMHGNGHCLVFDESYNLVYNVTAKGFHDDPLADMHEIKLTEDGTAIFTVYWEEPIKCKVNGRQYEGTTKESGFQEVDLKTNEVLFTWRASDHFSVVDSYIPYRPKYAAAGCYTGMDFSHTNSVEKTQDGNYLISARHLSIIALIDGTSGHPIWILGGKLNQFRDLSDGRATNFRWQHDARFLNDQNHITLFDNHGSESATDLGEISDRCARGKCESRGLHLKIDVEEMTVELVQEYFHPDGVNARAMGGYQTLKNGNTLIGWGYNPGFVEYKPDGTPVMDVQRGDMGLGFQSSMATYRVWKDNWVGRPTWPPSVAIDSPHESTLNATVYLSWNGATEVAKWAIVSIRLGLIKRILLTVLQFASNNSSGPYHHKDLIMTHYRSGFETSIMLKDHYDLRYIGAAAISKHGKVLGSTSIIDMANGKPISASSAVTLESIYHPSSSSHVSAAEYASVHLYAVIAGLAMVSLTGYFWWQSILRLYQAVTSMMPSKSLFNEEMMMKV